MSEPTFIDLQDMPDLKVLEPPVKPEKTRPSDQRHRVARETAPKPVTVPSTPLPRQSPSQSARVKPSPPAERQGVPDPPEQAPPSVSELLRRKPKTEQKTGEGGGKLTPNLMPSAGRMAKLEENYRRRFAEDIDEGSTKFLNTDDIQFGSFLRRFETSVYGVWRYPQEAALRGVEGVTPVKITFNKNGEIIKIKLLDSSGSRILDDEVFRTLRMIGPMGNLPKGYKKEEFNLIAFFQYGGTRGRLR